MLLETKSIFLKPTVLFDDFMIFFNLTLFFHVLYPALMSTIHCDVCFRISIISKLKIMLEQRKDLKVKNLCPTEGGHEHGAVYWRQEWLVLLLAVRIVSPFLPQQNLAYVGE